jgi:phosphohistidine phosphatase SixA
LIWTFGEIEIDSAYMKKAIVVVISAVLMSITFAGCPAKPEVTAPPKEHKPLVVFLVRHAEKMDDSKDPELSEDGKKRAADLIAALRSADIEEIHSTDYIRTKDTAAPIAEKLGVKVEIYNPKDLAGFAKQLQEKGGRHLVVGHSNTTPELTKLLGGNAGAEINEKSEYDRLYMVTIGKDGTANSVLVRYGKAYEETEDAAKAKGA